MPSGSKGGKTHSINTTFFLVFFFLNCHLSGKMETMQHFQIKVQSSMFYQGTNNTIYPGDNVSDDIFLGLVLVPQYMVSLLSSQSFWMVSHCSSFWFQDKFRRKSSNSHSENLERWVIKYKESLPWWCLPTRLPWVSSCHPLSPGKLGAYADYCCL